MTKDLKVWVSEEIAKALSSDRPFGYGDLQKLKPEPGAYAIYIPDMGIYFGSTGHLYRRRIKHIADLRNGEGENSNIQKAFDQYGLNRIMYLYMRATDREDAFDKEQAFIDAYQGDPLLCNFGTDARKPSLGAKYSTE